MLSSILAIVFVFRLSRNSDHYAPKLCIYFLTNLPQKYLGKYVDANDKILYPWIHLQIIAIIATVCHLKE